jgi:uncharacterized lipoprotein YddW (UPF0748 family)
MPRTATALPSLPALLLAMLIVGAASLLAAAIQGCGSQNPFKALTGSDEPEVLRGIWVTRWDYRSAVDVERAIDDVAAAGFTDVFWQVRGQADAFYRSSLEPWGEDLFRGREYGSDPGFDPLAVAVARARLKGLRIHAWVNVYPLWKGKEQPKSPLHPLVRRPQWRLFDQNGEPQPLGDTYTIMDPTNPEVQAHIAAVCRDIAMRYTIDGLHLDYVRFVNEGIAADKMYPAGPEAMARFSKATGRTSLTTVEDKAAHAAWIRDEITSLVERISRDARRMRPGIEISAAVWRDPGRAKEQVLQDAALWLKEGTIDRAIPMIYTEDNGEFVRDLNAWIAAAGKNPVTAGIGAYKHQPSQTLEQIRLSEAADGYCLFAFATFFESVNPFEPKDDTSVVLRSSRRRAIEPIQTSPARSAP